MTKHVLGIVLLPASCALVFKIIRRGKEKKAEHFEVRQRPNGKPVKTSLDRPDAAQRQTGGSLKQRIVAKEEGKNTLTFPRGC